MGALSLKILLAPVLAVMALFHPITPLSLYQAPEIAVGHTAYVRVPGKSGLQKGVVISHDKKAWTVRIDSGDIVTIPKGQPLITDWRQDALPTPTGQGHGSLRVFGYLRHLWFEATIDLRDLDRFLREEAKK